ncbi:hypothetical protein IP88_08235 [alpha proteobacterium AAP81b]|nr:hypothetical protein IP88_08235 [alpha proteobacterium AAP81b]
MRLLLAGLLALAPPAVAMAQAASPPAVAAPVDPARLAIARRLAAALMPPGSFRTMMGAAMDQVAQQSLNSAFDLPVKSFMGAAGLPADAAAKLPPTTVRELMRVVDPAFEERTRRMLPVLTGGMVEFVSAEEPNFREGYAEAMARRFDAGQLLAIEAFFKTPTGAAYAASMLTLQTDPAFVARSQAMIPRMMQAMPAIMAKVTAATADLPKPRKFDDLTEAERAELARLLGLPELPAKKGPTT